MLKTQELKDSIWSAITKEAAPIYKVAEKAGVSVQTASKYCYVLQAEGKVHMEKFGNMNLVRRTR